MALTGNGGLRSCIRRELDVGKINFSQGIRLAALMFFIQLALPTGSYLFGCWLTRSNKCSVINGIDWTLRHPVFQDLYLMIAFWSALGFTIGAFGGLLAAAIPNAFKKLSSRLLVPIFIIIFLVSMLSILWILPYITVVRSVPLEMQ